MNIKITLAEALNRASARLRKKMLHSVDRKEACND